MNSDNLLILSVNSDIQLEAEFIYHTNTYKGHKIQTGHKSKNEVAR